MSIPFPKLGGKGRGYRLPRSWVRTMYRDYQRLGSLEKVVGLVHNRTRQNMFGIFQTAGLKLRPRVFLEAVVYKGRKYTCQKVCGRHRYLRDTIRGRGRKGLRTKTVYLHHVIWEEHNGPIPAGHKVVFKDGNHLNWDISNLILLSNSDQVRRGATGANQFTKSAGERLARLLNGTVLARKLKEVA